MFPRKTIFRVRGFWAHFGFWPGSSGGGFGRYAADRDEWLVDARLAVVFFFTVDTHGQRSFGGGLFWEVLLIFYFAFPCCPGGRLICLSGPEPMLCWGRPPRGYS